MNTLKKLQFYMGKRKVLMPIALTLSGLSGLLSLMPFIFIWLIVRSLLLTGSVASGIPINVYAWWAVGTAVARPCHLLCRADAFALSGVPGRNQYATYGYEKNHADAAWLLRPEYQRTDA